MDRHLSHDEVAELLGAFALDAVDADEAAAVEAHLAQCPRCAAEVAQHRAVAGLIANAGVDAPAELWERIAARVGGAATPAPRVAPSPTVVTPLRPRRPARRRLPAWAVLGTVAAAAVVVMVVLAVQVGHLDQRVGALAAAGRSASMGQAVQEALLDPAAHRVALLDTTSGPPHQAALLLILPGGSAYALSTGLASLPSNRTYQLWGFVAGRPVSLGVLGNDPRQVAFTVDAPSKVTSYALTDEPAGGSVTPTGSPVAGSSATA